MVAAIYIFLFCFPCVVFFFLCCVCCVYVLAWSGLVFLFCFVFAFVFPLSALFGFLFFLRTVVKKKKWFSFFVLWFVLFCFGFIFLCFALLVFYFFLCFVFFISVETFQCSNRVITDVPKIV